MNNFVKERNEAFINFVETGNMEKVDAYCKKYSIPMPKSISVKKAGIYKAVQEVTTIPEEIKEKALFECIKLGFNPFIGKGGAT